MFLIYTDDIVDGMECLINLFADDTSVQQQITDITTFFKENRDLQRVTVLGEQWLIEFKAIKTECRENEPNPSSPTNHPDLLLNSENILEVDQHTHLGVTFSNTLS